MRVDRDGGVHTVTFGRPEKLNAMNAAQWRELHAALRAAEADDDARVVVLRAEGRAFCAGNDIEAMAACRTRAEARSYFVDTMLPAFEALATTPLPVVAAVGGMTLGGGVEIVQFCDLAVAARSATFRLPETRVGVWPTVFAGAAPYVGQRRLTQTMAIAGATLSAAEAKDGGLVTHVAPDAELDAAVADVVAEVTAGSRAAVAYTKRFANRALVDEGLPAVRAALHELVDHTMGTPEYEHLVSGFTGRKGAGR